MLCASTLDTRTLNSDPLSFAPADAILSVLPLTPGTTVPPRLHTYCNFVPAAASDAFTVNSAASPGRTVNAFGCSKILTAGTTTSVPLEITGAAPFSTSSVYTPASLAPTLPIRSNAPVPPAILSPLRFH